MFRGVVVSLVAGAALSVGLSGCSSAERLNVAWCLLGYPNASDGSADILNARRKELGIDQSGVERADGRVHWSVVIAYPSRLESEARQLATDLEDLRSNCVRE